MGGNTSKRTIPRWQWRALTLLVAAVVGLVLALLLYQPANDWLLLRRLGSSDREVREKAIAEAVATASRSGDTLSRIENALDDAPDRQFAALVKVLRHMRQFDTPRRDALHIDRIRTIELATSQSPGDSDGTEMTRRLLVVNIIRDGRDNKYVRQALALAADDEAPAVRTLGAALAARLGDVQTLEALLADEEPAVAGLAAWSAAQAGLLDDPDAGPSLRAAAIELVKNAPPQAAGHAAAALAMAAEPDASAAVARLMMTDEPALRDALLTTLPDTKGARDAVTALLRRSAAENAAPSPALLLAARNLRLADAAEPVVRAVLEMPPDQACKLTEGQLLAAVEAANALGIPVAQSVLGMVEGWWSPQLGLLMEASCRLLGRQIARDNHDLKPSLRMRAIVSLRQAAVWERVPESAPADAEPTRTPLASAAASVALWRIGDGVAEMYVRSATAMLGAAVGDYVAWEIARTSPTDAMELGMAMLPPPLDPDLPPDQQPPRVYNDDERSAGAMMLALAPRQGEDRAAARRRIKARLEGDGLGPETAPLARGSLQCGLLLLGDDSQLADVRELLEHVDFPPQRAYTALWGVGDLWGLDRALAHPRRSDEEVNAMLARDHMRNVLAAVAPKLGPLDPALPHQQRLWQVQRIRQAYLVQRGRSNMGLRR
jgi:hypothetical protein